MSITYVYYMEMDIDNICIILFPGTKCLNLHTLGEQWIEEVTDVDIVRTTTEEHLEGKHLKFKAHIRGWKAGTRERRCQNLLAKTET